MRAGSGHDWEAQSNQIEPWVLELKLGEVEGRVGVRKKRQVLALYKGDEYQTPPRP